MTEPQFDRSTLHACVGDGADGVRQMIGDVTALAAQFRKHDLQNANLGMVRLANDLQALVVLVQSLRGPVAVEASSTELPSENALEQLVALLEGMVAAQAGQDWLTVADVLEYDLEPALTGWLDQFEAATQALAA